LGGKQKHILLPDAGYLTAMTLVLVNNRAYKRHLSDLNLLQIFFSKSIDHFQMLLFALKVSPPLHWASAIPIIVWTTADVHSSCFYT